MRLYLCSQYERRYEMAVHAEKLEADGHTVLSEWITGAYEPPSMERSQTAACDAADLLASDCLVFFSEPIETNNKRGGRMVEFGMAWAWRKRIIIIGPREECVFHHLAGVEQYNTFDEARSILKHSLPQEARLR